MWSAFWVWFIKGDMERVFKVGLFAPDRSVLMAGLDGLVKDGAIRDLSVSPALDAAAPGPAAFWDWYRAL